MLEVISLSYWVNLAKYPDWFMISSYLFPNCFLNNNSMSCLSFSSQINIFLLFSPWIKDSVKFLSILFNTYIVYNNIVSLSIYG